MAGKKIKKKCYLKIISCGNFFFSNSTRGERFDMRKGVRIDIDEFLLNTHTFIPDCISYDLDKAYRTVIRRLKLRQ